MGLSEKTCIPCRGGVPPLEHDAIVQLRAELSDGWQVIDDHHLDCSWTFDNFAQALTFTNRIGALAEAEDHHPDIHLERVETAAPSAPRAGCIERSC